MYRGNFFHIHDYSGYMTGRPVQDPFRITSEKRVWIMVRDIDQDPWTGLMTGLFPKAKHKGLHLKLLVFNNILLTRVMVTSMSLFSFPITFRNVSIQSLNFSGFFYCQKKFEKKKTTKNLKNLSVFQKSESITVLKFL